MKKIVQLVPFATVLLLVFALISVVWANQQKGMAVSDEKYDDYITLENLEYNEENEGKNIVVYDTLSLAKPAYEKETGLKVNCAVLVRVVEMYQYVLIDDSVYKSYQDFSQSNIEGKRGELYENPEFPEEYFNKAMFGEVWLDEGGLKIDQSLLEDLVKTSFDTNNIGYKQLNPDIKIKGFSKDEDGTFSNSKGDSPKIGDIRIRYYYLTVKSLKNVLVVGQQQGKTIVKTADKLSGIDLQSRSLEELKTEKLSDHNTSSKGFIMFAGIEVVAAAAIFAIRVVRLRKKGGKGNV